MDTSATSISKIRIIYWAVTAVFAAFAVVGLFIVSIAASQANKHAINAEERLVKAEMMHIAERTKIEQSEVTHWDESMERLVLGRKPDKGFATENLSDWLISDFGFSEFALLDQNDKAKMVAVSNSVDTSEAKSELAVYSRDLVQLARKMYHDKRYEVDGKYLVDPEAGQVTPDIQAFAFRNWQGMPSIIVAQVMIAETPVYAANDNQEYVMISVKPLTPAMISKTATRLGLSDVSILPVAQGIASGSTIEMPDGATKSSLKFKWTPVEPRADILTEVSPIGALTTLCLALLLGVILRSNHHLFTELVESQQTNGYLATHDKLTGLANRQKFESALDGAFEVIKNSGFAVMFIDLDNFKQANDTYGHHAGDAVLKISAERIQSCVGKDGLVARLGGDEFVILLTNDIGEDAVCWLADQVIETCSQPTLFEQNEISVGASIGIALAPRDGTSSDEILKAADAALYKSKKNGRGRASVWNMAA